jgi:hypothetical protein
VNHPSDDERLLPILGAEVGSVGRHGLEELADHRRHAVEMARPPLPFKPHRRPAHDDPRGIARRIDGRYLRGVDPPHAMRRELRRVGGERPRIPSEILLRTKLGRIHEDRDGNVVAVACRLGHEAHVARVQRSHRGHESHPSTGGPRLDDERPHANGIVHDLLHHAIASTTATASWTA